MVLATEDHANEGTVYSDPCNYYYNYNNSGNGDDNNCYSYDNNNNNNNNNRNSVYDCNGNSRPEVSPNPIIVISGTDSDQEHEVNSTLKTADRSNIATTTFDNTPKSLSTERDNEYQGGNGSDEVISGEKKKIDLKKLFTPASDYTEHWIQPHSNRKMYASSSFYSSNHPTVEEQLELARRISASLSDISNQRSKGQSMYVNRKKRSVKWVHEGEGKGGPPENQTSSFEEESESKKMLKLVMNPQGQVQDLQTLKKQGYNVESAALSPEVCFDLVKDMNATKGKGAELFAKRRKKSEKWVIEGNGVGSENSASYSHSTNNVNGESFNSTSFSKEEVTHIGNNQNSQWETSDSFYSQSTFPNYSLQNGSSTYGSNYGNNVTLSDDLCKPKIPQSWNSQYERQPQHAFPDNSTGPIKLEQSCPILTNIPLSLPAINETGETENITGDSSYGCRQNSTIYRNSTIKEDWNHDRTISEQINRTYENAAENNGEVSDQITTCPKSSFAEYYEKKASVEPFPNKGDINSDNAANSSIDKPANSMRRSELDIAANAENNLSGKDVTEIKSYEFASYNHRANASDESTARANANSLKPGDLGFVRTPPIEPKTIIIPFYKTPAASRSPAMLKNYDVFVPHPSAGNEPVVCKPDKLILDDYRSPSSVLDEEVRNLCQLNLETTAAHYASEDAQVRNDPIEGEEEKDEIYRSVPVKKLINAFEKSSRPIMRYKQLQERLPKKHTTGNVITELNEKSEQNGKEIENKDGRNIDENPNNNYYVTETKVQTRNFNSPPLTVQQMPTTSDEIMPSVVELEANNFGVHLSGYSQSAINGTRCQQSNAASYREGLVTSVPSKLGFGHGFCNMFQTIQQLSTNGTDTGNCFIEDAFQNIDLRRESRDSPNLGHPPATLAETDSEVSGGTPSASYLDYGNGNNYNTAPRGWQPTMRYYRPVTFQNPNNNQTAKRSSLYTDF